eukprot:GGOE01001248.1.p3 GENE.GGOE01001248.1~~GGOE01001248.1.p3  ORF type:complete len:117 (-),score=13.74 GGOE01001248.1:235-585(-)
MTIVESAALGAASVIDGRGGIGVTDLLVEEGAEHEVFTVDMRSVSDVARYLKDLLGTDGGRKRLTAVSTRACKRALQYTEVECGALLAEFLMQPSSEASTDCTPTQSLPNLSKGRL